MEEERDPRKIIAIITALGIIIAACATPFVEWILGEEDTSEENILCNAVNTLNEYKNYFIGQQHDWRTYKNLIAPQSAYQQFDTVYYLADDSITVEEFQRHRFNAYAESLKKICTDQFPYHINYQALDAWQENIFKKNPEGFMGVKLDRVFFNQKHDIEYLCDSQQFACKLSIGFKYDSILPPKIGELIDLTLVQLNIKQTIEENRVNTSIDVGKILEQLKNHENFSNEYCSRVQEFWEELKIFYPDRYQDENDCQIFFKLGKFEMNPISAYIIRYIAKEFENQARLYPNKRYKIISIGYADQVPIIKAIPYGGLGHWDPQKNLISLTNPNGPPIGSKIPANNSGLLRLGYARGCAGILQLKYFLDVEQSSRPTNIQYAYIGQVSSARDAFERRVEFKMIEY